jgi:16S rRNA (guanine527-N7)-methyltransferase
MVFSPSDIGRSVRQALASLAPRLSLGLPPGAEGALATWASLVVTWNARLDLTAARSPDELVNLLVADAALLAAHAPPDGRWVDVGSGAGAPGLGLGLLRPDLSLVLCEALQKRVAFLRNAVGTLRTTNVSVARGLGEDMVGLASPPFTAASARAVLPPAAWLALGHRLAPGGSVVVFLAKEEPPALAGRRLSLDLAYTWPLTGAARRMVWYEPETLATEA